MSSTPSELPGPAAAASSGEAPPGWDAVTEELPCSRCDYDLRGLVTPRCPECGLEFQWADLLNHDHRAPRWLFEYHWRNRPLGSWFGTCVRMFWPNRVWKRSLSLHLPVRPAGLWLLLGLSVAAPWLVFTALIVAGCLGGLFLDALIAGGHLRPRPFGGEYFPEFFGVLSALLRFKTQQATALLALLLFEGALLATLCGLRETLARCRVRSAQMLRVTALTCAGLMAALGGAVGVDVILRIFRIPLVYALPDETSLGVVAAGGVWMLWGGLAHYLRLPHAAGVALVSIVLAGLFAFTAIFVGAEALGYR